MHVTTSNKISEHGSNGKLMKLWTTTLIDLSSLTLIYVIDIADGTILLVAMVNLHGRAGKFAHGIHQLSVIITIDCTQIFFQRKSSNILILEDDAPFSESMTRPQAGLPAIYINCSNEVLLENHFTTNHSWLAIYSLICVLSVRKRATLINDNRDPVFWLSRWTSELLWRQEWRLNSFVLGFG